MQVQPGKEYKYLPKRGGGGCEGAANKPGAAAAHKTPPPLTYGLFQTGTAAQRELDLDDDLTDQDGRVHVNRLPRVVWRQSCYTMQNSLDLIEL